MTPQEIRNFVAEQCADWEMCGSNFAMLGDLVTKTIKSPDGKPATQVRFNPGRIASSTAKTGAVMERPCFLCRSNRPAEQKAIRFGEYEILVNPFPIFPIHLTIASVKHKPQTISKNIGAMLDLTEELQGLTVFYNGPRCGASAPDHHHFQAADFPLHLPSSGVPEGVTPLHGALTSGIVISSADRQYIINTVRRILELLPQAEPEPMVNILSRLGEDGRFTVIVYPRRRHRPSCYGRVLISPASVEMAGYIITPRREDFDAMDFRLAAEVFGEVSFNNQEILSLCNRL